MFRPEEYSDFMLMLNDSRRILYSVCLAFTDRKADSVNDMYQEIVCNLWRGWRHFRGDSSKSTWIYRIALNTATCQQKKRRKNELREFIPLDDHLFDTIAEPKDPRIEELYQLIEHLSDYEKKMILLYIEGISHAEIAAIVGKKEDAVRQNIHRITQKLVKLHQQEIKNEEK